MKIKEFLTSEEIDSVNLISGDEFVQKKILDRNILSSVLIETLKNISEEELVSLMYSKFEAIIDFANLCNGKKAGEKISMLFNPHRYSTKRCDAKSLIESFSDIKFLFGLSRAILFKEGKVKELLYQCLQLGINGGAYINEFPPFIARDYYVSFQAESILDPCAGWGEE